MFCKAYTNQLHCSLYCGFRIAYFGLGLGLVNDYFNWHHNWLKPFDGWVVGPNSVNYLVNPTLIVFDFHLLWKLSPILVNMPLKLLPPKSYLKVQLILGFVFMFYKYHYQIQMINKFYFIPGDLKVILTFTSWVITVVLNLK